jgi:ABC-type multidrug transport system ATPase subunit
VTRRRASGGGARPHGEVLALDGLDLAIQPGEFFGLLGPNGAGKTTTIGILTTRVRATSGSAMVAGADVSTHGELVRRRIGVVPQRPNPDRGLSVLENLLFHGAYFGLSRAISSERAGALLEQLGISDKRDAKVDELSGGQQQRLMIARALLHEPQVIFLDEPTVGLDPQARLALWDILRELHAVGRTIVMTTSSAGASASSIRASCSPATRRPRSRHSRPATRSSTFNSTATWTASRWPAARCRASRASMPTATTCAPSARAAASRCRH